MVNIHPRLQRLTIGQLAISVIAVSIGFALDIKYFSMCQDEMDTFMEKSQLWGNWRERNGRKKPIPDPEMMQE